jgi:hypothetical protein
MANKEVGGMSRKKNYSADGPVPPARSTIARVQRQTGDRQVRVALAALAMIGGICRRHGQLVMAPDPEDSTHLLELWLAAVDDLRALRDTLNLLDGAARRGGAG